MMLKRTVIGIIILVFILFLFLIARTIGYKFGKVPTTDNVEEFKPMPSEKALKRFSKGIQIPTISNEVYAETNFKPFKEFMSYLPQAYPKVYEVMETDTVNQYSLFFRWKGKDNTLKPILFLSHYDVVPVVGYDPQTMIATDTLFQADDKALPPIEETTGNWDYSPFSGAIVNGRIYGRGTLDMKCMLFSLMEGADKLINEGFQPERDIYFAFGHDEEVSGRQGALKIADYFKDKGLSFDAVYDEGGIVAAPGSAMESIRIPLGLVGIGEKGFLTLRLKVKGMGGHSSMPPAKGSLDYAAEIICKLNSNQLKARIISPIASFLDNIGGEMDFASRMAIANQWLLKNILLNTFEKSPASNALVRTTTAATMIKASDAPNVLSSVTEVTVNFRILPGESVQEIIEHVKRQCKGYDVEYEVISAREPSNISPINTRGFEMIKEKASKLYPNAIISSYITIGGTDAYKYEIVSDNVYRFIPIELNSHEQRTIHNENEHISIVNYGRLLWYFEELMKGY